MTDISVIIVNWNTKDLLEKCLRSIYDHASSLSLEVIVVDNSSTDGSVGMLKNIFPGVTVIENDHNAGFAKANNQGIAKAKGRYILLLNSDTEVKGNALKLMVDGMENRPEMGACTSTITDVKGHEKYKGRYLLGFNDLVWPVFISYSTYAGISEMIFNKFHNTKTGVLRISCLSGAVCMLRREVISSLGGLDETMPFYVEDVDLCYRIIKNGWKIGCFTGAEIMHIGQASSRNIPISSEIALHRSLYAYFKKHYGPLRAAIAGFLLKLAALIRVIIWGAAYSIIRSDKAANRLTVYRVILTTRLDKPTGLNDLAFKNNIC